MRIEEAEAIVVTPTLEDQGRSGYRLSLGRAIDPVNGRRLSVSGNLGSWGIVGAENQISTMLIRKIK